MIIQDGLRRMLGEQEDVFYYLTLMNENYPHPPMPEGAEEGIKRGMYLLRESSVEGKPRVQLLGSGTILREVLAAAELLESDHGVAADVWSVTSFTELARDGIETERWNRLHPTEEARRSYVATQLDGRSGPADRGDRLHAHVRGADPAVPAGRRTRCSAPTASAAATTASSCAGSSRSTATTSRWRR